jgi:hypothetical protein
VSNDVIVKVLNTIKWWFITVLKDGFITLFWFCGDEFLEFSNCFLNTTLVMLSNNKFDIFLCFFSKISDFL